MSAFLLLLVKINLAMGAAIVLVSLLRRPLRAQFGAPIAYAVWFLVPIAGIASLFPPRVAAPVPAPVVQVPVAFVSTQMPVAFMSTQVPVAFTSVTGKIAHSALRVTEQLTGQNASVLAVPPSASAFAMPDPALPLFVAWALGTLLMALYLTLLQLRFHTAVRLREAGPAVLGFLRPSIVTPDGFQERFTPQEQAAILAHEQVHLARQDARVNALAAFLRCICWFNPLIHFGARWMRIDQELACDATTVAGAISRRDYANALLKSQMMITVLPLGCDWPGPQHPLIERIALLKRKPPDAGRSFVGMGLVMVAAVSAGFGAWAAQPPVAAKTIPTKPASMVLAKIPAMVAAPRQTVVDAGPDQPAADGTPTNEDEASKKVRADRAISPALAPPRTVSIDTRMQSVLAALPQIALDPEPKIVADQYPTGQDATSAPKETLAKNTVTALATGGVPAAGAVSDAATEPVVMANTPSGSGDPNTIVCRAPQRIVDGDQFGPESCGHNYDWLKLAMNGKDLASDGKTLIARATVDNPKGDGDPDAVTCRTPVEIVDSASRFKRHGPVVCRTNRFWADAYKHHWVVDAYGAGGNDASSNSLAEYGRVYGSAYGPEANFTTGATRNLGLPSLP
jgi:beta-lactamase regulating signal transducer with metallopeptidase domain